MDGGRVLVHVESERVVFVNAHVGFTLGAADVVKMQLGEVELGRKLREHGKNIHVGIIHVLVRVYEQTVAVQMLLQGRQNLDALHGGHGCWSRAAPGKFIFKKTLLVSNRNKI